jgi:hypothetical protein
MDTDRELLLNEAKQLIMGDRNQDYGDPKDNFAVIANMWSLYLNHMVHPHDVAAMMIIVKLSRVQTSPGKWDSWVDMAGYAALGGEVMPSD